MGEGFREERPANGAGEVWDVGFGELFGNGFAQLIEEQVLGNGVEDGLEDGPVNDLEDVHSTGWRGASAEGLATRSGEWF